MVSSLEAFIFSQYLSVCSRTSTWGMPHLRKLFILAQNRSDHSAHLDQVSILRPLILAIRHLKTFGILFYLFVSNTVEKWLDLPILM